MQAFSTCPDTVAEIDTAIHDEQARADLTFNTDESVVDQYNKRKKTIAKLEKSKEEKEKALEKHQEEIEEVKAAWLGPLKELLDRINDNFSYFFTCMKCAGEVDLKVPENPVSQKG